MARGLFWIATLIAIDVFLQRVLYNNLFYVLYTIYCFEMQVESSTEQRGDCRCFQTIKTTAHKHYWKLYQAAAVLYSVSSLISQTSNFISQISNWLSQTSYLISQISNWLSQILNLSEMQVESCTEQRGDCGHEASPVLEGGGGCHSRRARRQVCMFIAKISTIHMLIFLTCSEWW